MKSCLVVDDSRVTRKVARRILEELSFDVTEAQDGAAALDLCRKAMPNAILLDWNMPVMDGLTFLKQLRRTDGGKAPVVVFCTTENDLEHITDALTEGASEYIMKPFDAEILQAKFIEAGLIERN
ncbi:MAG: response regulator [Asticcacaulis sp.]|nr:response regulator [Asticcacaulis sp.]MBW8881664.1 response regulator [Asticcacaulis sp.]